MILAAITMLFGAFILYCFHVFSYWTKKCVTCVTIKEYLSLIKRQYQQPGHKFWREFYYTHPKIFATYSGTVPTIVVSDLALIKQVLVRDFWSFSARVTLTQHEPLWEQMLINSQGQRWKRQKMFFSQAFSGDNVASLLPELNKIADTVIASMEEAIVKTNGIVNVESYTFCYVLSAIAKTLFLRDIEPHKIFSNSFTQHASDLLSDKTISLSQPLLPNLRKQFHLRTLKVTSVKYFLKYAQHILLKYNSHNLFIGSPYYNDVTYRLADAVKKHQMTETEFLANLLFLLRTLTPNINVLNWLTYHLAMNPEKQDRLYAEVNSIIGTEELKPRHLGSLVLTEACLKESIRLGAAHPVLYRVCTQKTRLSNIELSPGVIIAIPIAGIHSNPEYFPQPGEFHPERFLAQNRSALVPFTFLGFGEGLRQCGGTKFAMMLMKLFITKLVSRFRLSSCAETPPTVEALLSSPKYPVVLRLSPRSKSTVK